MNELLKWYSSVSFKIYTQFCVGDSGVFVCSYNLQIFLKVGFYYDYIAIRMHTLMTVKS